MKIKSIILVFLMISMPNLKATDRKDIENERKKKLDEIEETNKILAQTKGQKNISLKQLRMIQNLIKIREEIIGSLAEELNSVEQQVNLEETELTALEIHLRDQKTKYAKSIYNAYRLKGSVGNKWHFIFSAHSFNQIAQRLRYLQKIAEFQNRMVSSIEEDKLALQDGILVLKGLKSEKEIILDVKEGEKVKLEGDKSKQQDEVNKLSGKEKELRIKLQQQRAAKAKLDREIERLISLEIEKARRAEEARRKKENQEKKGAAQKEKDGNESKSTEKQKIDENTATKTPESVLSSNAFVLNKGKLPWPVSNGLISERFGKHAHPTLSGVTIENNGINFLSNDGAIARSIFKGEVVAVMEIPGMQNMVMVSHGDYFTVYAKLSSVYVKVGDKVDTKQNIGKIYTDEDNETELHFELWFKQEKQNPEYWISR